MKLSPYDTALALTAVLVCCSPGVPSPAQQAELAKIASDGFAQKACVAAPEAGIGKRAMAKEIDDCLARLDGGAE